MSHLIPPDTSTGSLTFSDGGAAHSTDQRWSQLLDAMELALDAGERDGTVPKIETSDLSGDIPAHLIERAYQLDARISQLHTKLRNQRDAVASDLSTTHRSTNGWNVGAPAAQHLNELA